MTARNNKLPVLLAGDDEPEMFLTRQALIQAGVANQLISLRSVQDVVRYLRCVREPGLSCRYPRPSMVLLDIGWFSSAHVEVLRWVAGDREWCDALPVIILSRAEQPQAAAAALHVHAYEYLLKPSEFPNLLRLASELHRRWLDALEETVPGRQPASAPKVQNK